MMQYLIKGLAVLAVSQCVVLFFGCLITNLFIVCLGFAMLILTLSLWFGLHGYLLYMEKSNEKH